MKRIVASVISVNVAIGLIGFLYIWWRSQDASVVDLAALGASTDPALAEVLRTDAAGAAITWWVLVIVGVAVCAFIWLVLALRKAPATPEQARSSGLSWWLLLLLALGIAFGAGYQVYVNPAVAAAWRLTLVVGGLAIVPLAYFLSTAFGVKASMTPSVPFASVLRR